MLLLSTLTFRLSDAKRASRGGIASPSRTRSRPQPSFGKHTLCSTPATFAWRSVSAAPKKATCRKQKRVEQVCQVSRWSPRRRSEIPPPSAQKGDLHKLALGSASMPSITVVAREDVVKVRVRSAQKGDLQTLALDFSKFIKCHAGRQRRRC